MPNPRAIQRFSQQAFSHIKIFDKALNDYPTTQTFVIVTTKDPDVFSFVPKHLERFASDAVRIGTIDRPEPNRKTHMQLMQTALSMLEQLGPRYQFDSLVDNILAYNIREDLMDAFYQVDLVTRNAIDSDTHYKDQAVAVSNAITEGFMGEASRRLKGFKDGYEGFDLYKSLADLDIAIIKNMPRITLGGKPISKDDIWSWVEKQELNPDDKNDSEAIEKTLENLDISNQLVAGIAGDTANIVIVKYQNDINMINDLEINSQTS